MVVNTFMIRVGLKIKDIRTMVKAIILLYVGGFLLGGILESIRQYVRMGSLFLVLAIISYYMVLGIWKFISHLQRWNRYHCEVELYLGENVYRMKGLIDTGNSLRDPVSDLPVSILEKRAAEKLLSGGVKNIRYIPYQTIGRKDGVLQAFQIDKMCVRGEKECWIQAPLIGISEEKVSVRGEYEMILNPNLF